jgi:malonyl-CoA O-methyltransferase
VVCADIGALPFKADSFDLAWSNLALHWIERLPAAFAQLHRVLKVDGLLTFSCCGPDTLTELRQAFAAVDRHPHVNRFVDMHDLGDMLVAAGFADPVMDMERLTLTFADARGMMLELKTLGAGNAASGRSRRLTGKGRWQRMLSALERFRDRDGRLPATFEVVYGHAWKAPARTISDGRAIVRFDLPRR